MIRKGKKCGCVIGTGKRSVSVRECPVHGDKALSKEERHGD